MQGDGPVERLRISGIVRFGSVSTIGGATLAGFDLPTAQRLFDKAGQARRDRRGRRAGVPRRSSSRRSRTILPPTAEVKLASEQAEEDAADTNEFITFLQGFLLAFAGIALFVGSFVIANSLSITIAQRTREFATIRTLGALATPGARLDRGRGARRRNGRVDHRPLPRPRAREGPLQALRRWSASRCRTRGSCFETRTIVVSLLVGILVTLACQPQARDPGDPRAADRGRPRGRDAARVPLRTLPHARVAAC